MSVKRKRDDAENDAEIAANVVKQLEHNGPITKPWTGHSDKGAFPFTDYVVRREVQRSIDRVRLLDTYNRPDFIPVIDEHGKEHERIPVPKVTETDVRKAVAVLRKIVATEEQRAVLDQFDAIRQFPPEGVNALKHFCAAEAFDLMSWFSAKPPTGTEGGPFQQIAGLLFEAITSTATDDQKGSMKRSTDYVLEDRRKYDPNAFVR
jgi:hypothetical protein